MFMTFLPKLVQVLHISLVKATLQCCLVLQTLSVSLLFQMKSIGTCKCFRSNSLTSLFTFCSISLDVVDPPTVLTAIAYDGRFDTVCLMVSFVQSVHNSWISGCIAGINARQQMADVALCTSPLIFIAQYGSGTSFNIKFYLSTKHIFSLPKYNLLTFRSSTVT